MLHEDTSRLLTTSDSRLLKRLRGEAREKSTRGGVHRQYVDARRLGATKPMSLFRSLLGICANPQHTVSRQIEW